MVRALLAGTKTQTRRICKPQPISVGSSGKRRVYRDEDFKRAWETYKGSGECDANRDCPYGQPGDRLWVRETWAPCEAPIRAGCFQFAADGAVGQLVSTNGGDEWWERNGHTIGISDRALLGVWVGQPSKWRPSIHMPRGCSRLTLEIAGVRVERLRDISEADAIAEGVESPAAEREDHDRSICPACGGTGLHLALGQNLGVTEVDCRECDTNAKRYRHLWESINGPGSWDANPWVWVVEFKRADRKVGGDG